MSSGIETNVPRRSARKDRPCQLRNCKRLLEPPLVFRDYEITYPPCDNGAERVRWNYDGGKCCRRPQAEFVGRYYDTAVAAMALGATREEAFAPLMHARILAYALEVCDPKLSFRLRKSDESIAIVVKRRTRGLFRRTWKTEGTSLASFPVAHEVLYELYNTMLIERIRSRGRPRYLSDSQMKALRAAVFYEKMMASVTYVDLELHPDIMFPEAEQFAAVGLEMATSSKIADMSRMLSPNATKAKPVRDFELHSGLRFFTTSSIVIFEMGTRSWQRLDSSACNTNPEVLEYYPYKFHDTVWDKYEGCCAREGRFMAFYGRSFSEKSSNCALVAIAIDA